MNRIRLTLAPDTATTSREVDVAVGTPWARVVDEIPQAAGTRRIGPVPVLPDTVCGRWPLLDGALVEAGPPPPRPAVEITVTAGPATGRRAPLQAGPVVVGREPGCDLRLDDPACSRRHAEVQAHAGRTTVRDLTSTNPVLLDGHPLPPDDEQPWRDGATARIGTSTLMLRRTPTPAPPADRGDGTVVVRPRRVTAPPPRHTTLERPRAPRPQDLRSLDPVLLLAPLVASTAAALVLHSPALLLLGLAGPLIALVTGIRDRRHGRRRRRTALAEHRAAVASFDADLAAALDAERQRREATARTAWAATTAALDRGDALWSAPPGTPARWVPGRADLPARSVSVNGEEAPVLDDVPCEVPLAPGTTVLLDGPHARAAAQALLLSVATQHEPGALAVALVAEDRTRSAHWSMLARLPHRRPDLDETGPLAAWCESADAVVVVDGVDLDPHLDLGRAVVVVIGSRIHRSGAPLHLHTGEIGRGRLVLPDGTAHDIALDLLPPDVVDAVVRALCPLRPAGSARLAHLPDTAPLADVVAARLGVPALDATAVRRSWSDARTLGAVPIGMDADGPVLLDLAGDGPHALVAGTTGAGKSELLTSLVLGLALTHRPDVVSVLLVDFKGGATAAALSGLPHVCSVVTDLDPAGAARALTGLEAELKRRERLLAEQGARHVDDAVGVPRLVIVVDEFRVLAEEHPTFLAGLLRVATTGRSLGVHLVLATQRPAGIVSADIRANVALRIALRLHDTQDSVDVIGSPDAAHLPSSLPGRAVLRGADGPPRLVQVAHAASPAAAELPEVIVDGAARCSTSSDDDPLTRLVDLAAAMARELGLSRAPSPVPPPLPAHLDGETLLGVDAPALPAGLPIGLVDRPDLQRVDVLDHDPARDGHLAVVGVARSGRTSALRQLVAAALARPGGPQVHVIGRPRLVEGFDHPRLGSVVDPSSTRLVVRLLDLLHAGTGTPTLLVIDGWSAALAGRDPLTALALTDALTRLLAEGPGRGVHVAVSGDRTLLTGGIASHLTTRLALRLADAADLALAGLTSRHADAWTVPGRAVRAHDGATVQLALPPAALVAPSDEACSEALAPPPRLRALPRRVDVAPRLLGVGGDEAQPVALDLAGRRTVLVCGPPRSGRTTALHTLAAATPGVWVGRSPAPSAATLIDPHDPQADVLLAQALDSLAPGAPVLVDTLDDVDARPLEAALLAVADGRRHPVVVAASPQSVAGAYRGLAGALRRDRVGLLLGVRGALDGEPVGVRLDAWDDPVPGRGVLVADGRQVVVQVGLVAASGSTDAGRVGSCGGAAGTMGP